MSEFANYMEYCIEKKSEGSYRQKRIWLRIICILLGAAIIPAITWVPIFRAFIYFVPVWMGLMGILYWYLSRFVSLEYEYRILQGEFQMDVIYGQRQRKKLMNVRIRDMEIIHPLDEAHKADVAACDHVDDCSISQKHPTPDVYYFTYMNAEKKHCAVIFEATTKAMEIMKFYNHSALTVKPDLRH